MLLSKTDKENFLKKGGILLRTGMDRKGYPIIKKRTRKHDWHIHMMCETPEKAIEILNAMVEKNPDAFQKDQEN